MVKSDQWGTDELHWLYHALPHYDIMDQNDQTHK